MGAVESFCSDTFWNYTEAFNTTDPKFTRCFNHTALVWLPFIFLAVLTPLQIYFSSISKRLQLPWKFLIIAKLAVSLSLVIVTVIRFAFVLSALITDPLPFSRSDTVAALLLFVAMCIFFGLQLHCRQRGVITSGVIFVSYIVFAVCGVMEFKEDVQMVNQAYGTDRENCVTFIIYYVLILTEVILCAWADLPMPYQPVSSEDKPNPENFASFLSQMLYTWFTGLAILGWKRPLTQSDIWSLKEEHFVDEVLQYWKPRWNKKLVKYQQAKREHMFKLKEIGKKVKEPSPPSIVATLFSIFKVPFITAMILKEMADLIQFAGPQLLNLLIDFTGDTTQPMWIGFLYAVLMFVTAFLYTIFNNQHMFIMNKLGMDVKTVMTTSVYEKSLYLCNESRHVLTTGQMVNLMSVDVQFFTDVSTYMCLIWSSPIQVIKLYAWEKSFSRQVAEIRAKELKVLRKGALISSFNSLTWTTAPVLVAVAAFTTYVLSSSSNVLTPQTAFVSLSLLNILRMPLILLPMLTSYMVQASVSNKRLKRFLVSEELDPSFVEHGTSPEKGIVIEKGTFSWEKDQKIDDKEHPTYALKNINFSAKEGQFIAVVGSVGSGKSSLMYAILGEMEKIYGRVSVTGSVAYAPQQAWIQNLTLRNNILFGKKYRPDVYNKILVACALEKDLELLPGGDQTEIGEKGINLSGGQRQRISIARALYQDADLYLFDDPLSAVDSHVGKHIFDKVIGKDGYLKGKTRILVTNGLNYVKEADNIIVINDGIITESGTFSQLLSHQGHFAELVENFMRDAMKRQDAEPDELSVFEEMLDTKKIDPCVRQRFESVRSISISSRQARSRPVSVTSNVTGNGSIRLLRRSGKLRKSVRKEFEASVGKLIKEEYAAEGQVKLKVYVEYLKALGYFATVVVIIFYALSNGSSVGASVWLSKWSDDSLLPKDQRKPLAVWLSGYAALGISQGVFVMLATIALSFAMVSASKSLHRDLVHNILRSPLSFFDVTPLGRILNRCGKDIDTIDNLLPATGRVWIGSMLLVISVLLVIIISTPMFAIIVVPLAVFYYFVQKFFITTSRQLKRIESITRSPVYSHFQETISGVSTIRAYAMQDSFLSDLKLRLNTNQKCYFVSFVANRWLAVMLETTGNVMVFFAAIFAVLARDSDAISAGVVGLSISYALQITQILNIAVRMTSDLQSNVVAVERVNEYTHTPTEAEWDSSKELPKEWPNTGHVSFQNYSLRYREGLELVLKNIDCNIEGGEKIGIVGRTGAGKSSLTLALFRIVEPAQGTIVIDDVNITSIGLHQLRSNITIIPQEPMLFCGTLRMNLDPYADKDDSELWNALKEAHLKDFVSSLPEKLEYNILEGGENLSVGQRQLMCLARALLRKTKVLVLDEATAAVDLQTDDLIQKTIRLRFADCTILTIAHRLNTILDSNRVMVLDHGEIVEFDTPENLLADQSSIFYGMAKDAGLTESA